MDSIVDLIARLEPDPWREQVGFTPEIQSAHVALAGANAAGAASILNDWIYRHQPCLFGRVAAKTDRIHYCILFPADLSRSDEHIRDCIQTARTEWTRLGFTGQKSAFVIAAISERIALASPNNSLRALACRIASLYLLEDVQPDRVFLDSIWLEKAGTPPATWEWSVGANYFSSQGDGRWWRDHRFPGGMAFSMNSVGHMMKSGALANAVAALDKALGIATPTGRENLNDLGDALNLAMRTIAGASNAVSGPATFLLPQEVDDPTSRPACPMPLPGPLKGFSYCRYAGWYHTDFTIPSEYFESAVERPDSILRRSLDFTYLFHRDIDNPDHETMGSGRRIRTDSDHPAPEAAPSKMQAVERPLSDCPRLVTALGRRVSTV